MSPEVPFPVQRYNLCDASKASFQYSSLSANDWQVQAGGGAVGRNCFLTPNP